MNSEKMVITESKTVGGMYQNKQLKFQGDIHDAKIFASKHNFGGGVEIYDPKTRKFTAA